MSISQLFGITHLQFRSLNVSTLPVTVLLFQMQTGISLTVASHHTAGNVGSQILFSISIGIVANLQDFDSGFLH